MRRRLVRVWLSCGLTWGCAVAQDSEDGTSGGATTASAATSGGASEDEGESTNDVEPPDDDDSSSDTTTAMPGGSTEATSSSSTTTGDDLPDQVPPIDAAALRTWLEAGEYLEWDAESAIHASDGPHGGDVRAYVNAALFESLTAGATSHPIDAAVVKELYDVPNVVGWAVMVKVADGTGGDTWYWYEVVGGSTYADGTDVELCWGCHEDGADQVLTPFPLQ